MSDSPSMRLAGKGDLPRLEAIREAAFAPIFASFREMLGDELYRVVQAKEDQAQGGLLETLLEPGSGWEVYAAEVAGEVIGFVSIRLDQGTRVGEIGLNAVDPAFAGQGIGTAMYEYTLESMRKSGMIAATVATGGDPSHAPARRAYEKAGFSARIPSAWMCRLL